MGSEHKHSTLSSLALHCPDVMPDARCDGSCQEPRLQLLHTIHALFQDIQTSFTDHVQSDKSHVQTVWFRRTSDTDIICKYKL